MSVSCLGKTHSAQSNAGSRTGTPTQTGTESVVSLAHMQKWGNIVSFSQWQGSEGSDGYFTPHILLFYTWKCFKTQKYLFITLDFKQNLNLDLFGNDEMCFSWSQVGSCQATSMKGPPPIRLMDCRWKKKKKKTSQVLLFKYIHFIRNWSGWLSLQGWVTSEFHFSLKDSK